MTYDFDAIARSCFDNGVRHVFGITGSGNSLKLINAFSDNRIVFHSVSHEASAGLMAGGACYDNRTRAAALTIKGPGFANLLPAMLCNRYESRPALSISEAYPDSAPPQQMHKRLDHAEAASEFVKSHAWMDPDGGIVKTILDVAQRETPGPVHIDLAGQPASLATTDATHERQTEDPGIDAVLDLVRNSRRPLLLLGSWAMRADPARDWSASGVPVVTTAAAKGAMNEGHALAAGIVTGEVSAYSPEQNLIANADLIVAIGLRNSEVIRPSPFPCPLVLVDCERMTAVDGFQPTRQCTIADNEASAFDQVEAAMQQRPWGETEVRGWREKVDTWILQDDWQAGTAFQIINQHQFNDQRTRLVLDTGFFCTVGESVWRCAQPGDAVGSGVGRFMGVSVPTAIGVAIADPTRPVTCVFGDGGVGPYISELQLAASESLPILFVHMSDGGFGSVAAFGNGSGASVRATGSNPVDWCRSAECFGASAANVSDGASLEDALTAWQPANGPLFLSMQFDAERYRTIAKALR